MSHSRDQLKALPEEILLRIFDFFTTPVELEERLHQASEADSSPDYQTLSHITRSSRLFHRLAQPLLYRVLVLHERAQCALLLRSLLTRHQIGGLVRSLSIHVYDDEFDPETDAVLRRNLHIAGKDKHDIDTLIPLPDTAAAQLAVFLAYLPHLESLDVMLDDKDGLSSDFLTIFPRWKSIAARYVASNHERLKSQPDGASAQETIHSHFSELKQIRLRHWRLVNKNPRLQYATELLGLPSLSSLHCHWTNLSLTTEQIASLKARTTSFSLKNIFFENSSIDAASLGCILSRSEEIRSLVLSWGEDQGSENKMNYRQIGNILRSHCNSLQTLVLNPIKSRPVREAGDDATIGPMRELSQLKRLSIDSNALLGLGQFLGNDEKTLQDLLPPSLEALHLSFPIGAVKTGEKALYQLLNSAGGRLSDLRQVSVDDRNVKFRKDFETLGWTRIGPREIGSELPYYSGCFFPMLTRGGGGSDP